MTALAVVATLALFSAFTAVFALTMRHLNELRYFRSDSPAPRTSRFPQRLERTERARSEPSALPHLTTR